MEVIVLESEKRRTRTEGICQRRHHDSKKGGSILEIDLKPLHYLGGDFYLWEWLKNNRIGVIANKKPTIPSDSGFQP
ncbi:hypothetical protein JIR001_10600 [Polycladomyces abyssicola]|uniref:Uncharacterized protein n=1 Tax=Polycladomyces abyssicola TaxID=1125966 RepID=A0A8D5UFZ2_9BACL|nr:hypothetical protein [Polycladomyces abyssicola]BCU81277.1 hypothetical protein JIR001_10600 [Polycladomyces abyssicola]